MTTKLLYTDDSATRARYEHNCHLSIGPIIILIIVLLVAGACLSLTSILS